MKKRIIVLVFLTLALALWRGTDLFNQAVAQQKKHGATHIDYSKFKHSDHDGMVKSLTMKDKSFEIDCAYCHGDAVKDKLGKDLHDIATIGYPSHKSGVESARVHSACDECHAFTGPAIERKMCTICHDALTFNQKDMKTNIRQFMNPDGGGVSQFYDYYSHGEHEGYYESFILQTSWKDKMKFYDSKKDAKANKGLDKKKFECMTCHVMNTAPVEVGKIDFKTGVKMSFPAHVECWICHFDPKIVAPPKPDKPSPKNTFATNCEGCHRPTGAPLKAGRPVKGSELAPLWFSRLMVNNELEPVETGKKPLLPYSHKTHDKALVLGDPNFKNLDNYCLACHVTGRTANTVSDFYLEDRKSKENQPSAQNCAACHQKEMEKKLGGNLTIETAKCNYCHSLQTIRLFEARGIALPPPNHFFKKPGQPVLAMNMAPAPTPTGPATTPEVSKPVPAPAPTPVVAAVTEPSKPEPPTTPAAETTPEPKHPEPKQPEPKQPEPKQPEPAPAPAPVVAATEAPKQPEPTPAPTPAPEPSKPETAPAASPTPEPAATTAAAAEPKPAEATPPPKAEPTPAPPKPEPAPEPPKNDVAAAAPAAAAPPAAAAAGGGKGKLSASGVAYKAFPGKGKAQVQPKLPKLGDTKESPEWGLDEKWGVVENFDHEAHTQPKYSKSCEDCHHTSTDTRAEMALGMVPNCYFCHLATGKPDNAKNKNGDEVDVKIAYHGNPDNTTNNAGCIECHRRYYDTNPDAEKKAPTSTCAGCHAEKSAWFDRNRRPGSRTREILVELFDMVRGVKEREPVRIAARR
jgi:class III cytochrome C family protein